MFSFWEELERKKLRQGTIPKHIAIIMDGNGTWAKRRGLPRTAGHTRGADALRKVIREAAILGVKYLSVYAFSTENWKRPKEEINYLLNLFLKALKKETPELVKHKIKLKFCGELSAFSSELQKLMRSAEKSTATDNPLLQLNVMINYGGRRELLRATNLAIKSGKILKAESELAKLLYTKDIPDPDLLIRTSGQMRISNFMLWQIAYSEIWITKKCWPEFDGKLLRKAIKDYQKRERRWGGIKP